MAPSVNMKIAELVILAVILLAAVGCSSNATPQTRVGQPANGKTQSDRSLEFVGTVTAINSITETGFPWRVSVTIDRIVSGTYSENEIGLLAHDSSGKVLQVGDTYRFSVAFGRHGSFITGVPESLSPP